MFHLSYLCTAQESWEWATSLFGSRSYRKRSAFPHQHFSCGFIVATIMLRLYSFLNMFRVSVMKEYWILQNASFIFETIKLFLFFCWGNMLNVFVYTCWPVCIPWINGLCWCVGFSWLVFCWEMFASIFIWDVDKHQTIFMRFYCNSLQI